LSFDRCHYRPPATRIRCLSPSDVDAHARAVVTSEWYTIEIHTTHTVDGVIADIENNEQNYHNEYRDNEANDPHSDHGHVEAETVLDLGRFDRIKT